MKEIRDSILNSIAYSDSDKALLLEVVDLFIKHKMSTGEAFGMLARLKTLILDRWQEITGFRIDSISSG